VLAEVLVWVEFIRSRQGLGFGDTRAKLLPRHQRDDRIISIPLIIAAGDQRGANAREETNFVIDCSGIGLKGAGVPLLGFAEHDADQPVKQIDGLVGEAGGEVHADRYQCRVPALPFIVGDMLDRGAASFTRELCQPCLMDEMTTARLDTNATHFFQPLDQAKHSRRPGGFRHLPQPGQPGLATLLAALGQRIEALALFGGQPIGQPTICFSACMVAEVGAEPLKRGG